MLRKYEELISFLIPLMQLKLAADVKSRIIREKILHEFGSYPLLLMADNSMPPNSVIKITIMYLYQDNLIIHAIVLPPPEDRYIDCSVDPSKGMFWINRMPPSYSSVYH